MFLCNRAEPRWFAESCSSCSSPMKMQSTSAHVSFHWRLKGSLFPSEALFSIQNRILFDAKSSHRRNQGVWEHQFRRILSIQADLLFGTWNTVSKLSHFSKVAFGKRSDKEKWYFKHLEVIQPFLICQIEKHVCFQVWPLHIFPVGSESDTWGNESLSQYFKKKVML